jgi:hypothetical protein
LFRLRSGYATALSKFEDIEFQASRNILQRGRLQLTAGRNFLGEFNYLSANLSIDFDSFRSNSVSRLSRGRGSLTQSFRGSIGYDSGNQRFIGGNRQQVGRSAVGVRMFVDHNNNGRYQEGDELISEQAIRIERAGSAVHTEDGVTYLSQLQPYRQYNMRVNKSAIRNPLLVPLIENFSFVSDPNQYKVIDIPLYMSGVIEGTVQREMDGNLNGVAGLRLILEQTDSPEGQNPYSEELRTFSDGSFYAYEVHPGLYELRVDSSQLDLLNVQSVPEKLAFEIRATSEGDYIDNLGFILRSANIADEETVSDESTGITDLYDVEIRDTGRCNYAIQFGSYSGLDLSLEIAEEASDAFNRPVKLYYNANTSMYALRTVPAASLTESLNLLQELMELDPQHQYAVVSQCIDPVNEFDLIPLRLLISIGTFQDSGQADEAAAQLNADFNLGLHTRYLDDIELYILYEGPYDNIKSALSRLESLKSLPLPNEPGLIRDPDTLNRMEFEFRLQKGTNTIESDIGEAFERCRNKSNETCILLRDEEENNYIFINRKFTSWSVFLNFYENLRELTGTDDLIIHIESENQ